MKINDTMLYSHPVLSEVSTDYVDGNIFCSFTHEKNKSGQIKINSDIEINCDILKTLIDEQKASVGYFVICSQTYFNHLQTAVLGESEYFFDLNKLFGRVIIRPVVWSIEEINNFSSPLFNNDFDIKIIVPKGSILAIGKAFALSVDKQKIKPFESIFKLVKKEAVEPGIFTFDPYRTKIEIIAEEETFNSINRMRTRPVGRANLLTGIYMNVVTEIISILQNGDDDIKNTPWYRVFGAKCDELGINPEEDSRNALEIAQILFKKPLNRVFSEMEKL